MTRRERIISAIRHKQTDFTPYNIDFTHQEYEKVASFLNDRDFIEKIGNHLISVCYDGYLSENSPGSGYWKDDFGVVWNRNGADKDIGVIDGFIIKEPDLNNYTFPTLDEVRLCKEYEKLMGLKDGRFKFGSIGFSLFERAWSLRGIENLLTDMVLEPAFVDELLEAIVDYNIKVMDIALEFDIDGFHFGDDWGQQQGLIMGPQYWRRFIKPNLARMYARAKSKGLIVSQHSCGDIHEVFPDLIEIGLDVYQTLQPEIYNLGKIKKEFGNQLAFWGGISTQRLLPFADPDEVARVTKETIAILGIDGGYIAAPTHVIPGDVPPENVIAMLEVFQGKR